MNRFVASSGPAGALLHADGVVRTADEEPAATDLLHVAFQAEIRIALGQQLGINGAVDLVTGRAAFAQGFMLEDRGATLSRVTAETHVVLGQEGSTAPSVDGALVRRMTIGATHLALRHRMMIRQTELCAHIGVALEANRVFGPRRLDREPRAIAAGLRPATGEGIRRFDLTTRFGMQTGRAMTGLASGI